jgi:hypothetical protein
MAEITVIQTQRLVFAEAASLDTDRFGDDAFQVTAKDGDITVALFMGALPAEQGLYTAETADGEIVTVLYDPATVTLI